MAIAKKRHRYARSVWSVHPPQSRDRKEMHCRGCFFPFLCSLFHRYGGWAAARFRVPRLWTLLALMSFMASAPVRGESAQSIPPKPDISFRHEVAHAIDNGLRWLEMNQKTNGSWSTAEHPAVT